MTAYSEQIEAAKAAHAVVSSLNVSVQQQIDDAFNLWDQGVYNAHSIRFKLESIIRNGYRTASAVAAAQTKKSSGLDDLDVSTLTTTDYLEELIKDVRRNLRTYKKTDKEDAARRRVVLRTKLSAVVGTQRGYTDGLIASHEQLELLGYELEKLWLANFVDNVPCSNCTKLHGTTVGLHEEFPLPTLRMATYVDLQGPPAHPNCKCKLVILIKDLDNVFEKLDLNDPKPAKTTMTTAEVKKIPKKFFSTIVLVLRKIVSRIRGKK